VSLEARDGSVVEGTADVVRYTDGQRLARALPIGVGGTILGLCTIVIPGLHFVSTWLIPLLSIGTAVYFYNRKGLLGDTHATCPSCGAEMVAEGGPWEDPMYVRCNHCSTPLEVKLAKPL
jgi:hypothetical protein